jgi:5-hydroxyisourate hydrolase
MSLSTHVLDTTHGSPAAGISIILAGDRATLFEGVTDSDGRCPALKDMSFPAGHYTLRFAVAEYFRSRGIVLPEPPFLDQVTIEFGIADETAHYHVPLLVSPFGYSTYRGS